MRLNVRMPKPVYQTKRNQNSCARDVIALNQTIIVKTFVFDERLVLLLRF